MLTTYSLAIVNEPFFGIWNADRAILAAAAIIYEITSSFSRPIHKFSNRGAKAVDIDYLV
jgi:hypothetical protein